MDITIQISAVNGRVTLDFMQKFQRPVYLKAFLQELADNGIVYELQDNFFHFATASGDENKFQAKVEVPKHFGEVSLRLIAPGKAYNGQINNNAIHSRKQGSNMNRIKTIVALLLVICVFYRCLQWQQKRSREK